MNYVFLAISRLTRGTAVVLKVIQKRTIQRGANWVCSASVRRGHKRVTQCNEQLNLNSSHLKATTCRKHLGGGNFVPQLCRMTKCRAQVSFAESSSFSHRRTMRGSRLSELVEAYHTTKEHDCVSESRLIRENGGRKEEATGRGNDCLYSRTERRQQEQSQTRTS